jgi:hypothetical protein
VTKKETKDVMGDVINDISSAVEETVEEAMEETPEPAEEAALAPDRLVVKFGNEIDAARAVRVINKALRDRQDTIYQGAMISREENDELKVEDLSDMGLSDVITGTAALGFDLGRDGVRLVWTAATTAAALVTAGFKLLQRTALMASGLAGATRTIPQRRRMEALFDEDDLQETAIDLQPGETAVVLVADFDTASDLAADLVRSGGELA